MSDQNDTPGNSTLDPAEWAGLRAQARRMPDHLEHRRDLPLWQPAPPEALNGR